MPSDTDATDLLERIRHQAAGAGLIGPTIAAASPPPGAAEALAAWLADGRHGQMEYMARQGARRADPTAWAAWARSVAVFADSYDFDDPAPCDPTRAAISRYARGDDYHAVLKEKLARLCRQIESAGHRALPFVDTSPLMERALAAAGGLGWIGKNSNLLNRRHGSFFFLGGLVTDLRWPRTPPEQDGCGDCVACLISCPTGAIVSPGVVDARLCISYLTIELKGAIPPALRPAVGNRVFGCDDCQEVCPWNELAVKTPDPAYRARPELAGPELVELALLDEQAYFDRFRGTAVRRARWRGLLRNVMVALGNWGEEPALPALLHGLVHPEPLVRAHAAWGLGRVGGPSALGHLRARRTVETEAAVQLEIDAAIRDASGTADPNVRGPVQTEKE